MQSFSPQCSSQTQNITAFCREVNGIRYRGQSKNSQKTRVREVFSDLGKVKYQNQTFLRNNLKKETLFIQQNQTEQRGGSLINGEVHMTFIKSEHVRAICKSVSTVIALHHSQQETSCPVEMMQGFFQVALRV